MEENKMDKNEKLKEYAAKMLNNISLTERLVYSIEEMSELTKEYTKLLRKKYNRSHLIEEMADVAITLVATKEYLGISDEELETEIARKAKERYDYDVYSKKVC